jgi:hypothetical protein
MRCLHIRVRRQDRHVDAPRCQPEADTYTTAVNAFHAHLRKWPDGDVGIALVKAGFLQHAHRDFESPTNVMKKNTWYYDASSHRVVSNCTES